MDDIRFFNDLTSELVAWHESILADDSNNEGEAEDDESTKSHPNKDNEHTKHLEDLED